MSEEISRSLAQPRRTAAVLLNSSAGSVGAPELAHELKEKFSASGITAEVILAESGDLDAALDRVCSIEADVIVAAGGDGTQSAVASRLAGTQRVQGVLPLGTLNHFAKDLGIPQDIDDAVRTIAEGEARAVDVAEVNGHVFINNSSIGLYPMIVRERERQQEMLGRGKWAALVSAAFRVTARVHRLQVRIATEEKSMARPALSVFIGNNDYTMEGFAMGERESLTEGRLSLFLTPPSSRLRMLWMAIRALLGHLEDTGTEKLAGEAFDVQTHHAKLQVATDGEVCELQTPLRYRVRPAALRVIVPANQERGSVRIGRSP